MTIAILPGLSNFACTNSNPILFTSHSHGLYSRFQFLRFLTGRTHRAEYMVRNVSSDGTGDSILRSDFGPHRYLGSQIKRVTSVAQTAQTAALAHSFSVFPKRVARAKVGHDANAAVIETSAQSVFPFSRHDLSINAPNFDQMKSYIGNNNATIASFRSGLRPEILKFQRSQDLWAI